MHFEIREKKRRGRWGSISKTEKATGKREREERRVRRGGGDKQRAA